MAASGAQEQLERKPGYYQSLLEMEHDARLKETIRTGVTKLSPHCNPFFRLTKKKKACNHQLLLRLLLN